MKGFTKKETQTLQNILSARRDQEGWCTFSEEATTLIKRIVKEILEPTLPPSAPTGSDIGTASYG